MSAEAQIPTNHDINEIAERFPDLALSSGMDEPALKELQAKYTIRLQIADQALREREIKLKEKSSNRDRWANPLTVGILVAALGLVGNFINGLWRNRNQQQQLDDQRKTEKIKLQNDLIKEAIKPPTAQERAKSLVFFADNKLIELDKDVVELLRGIVGEGTVVPGSSSAAASSGDSSSVPLAYSAEIVARISGQPGIVLPPDFVDTSTSGHKIEAIILHISSAPDSVVELLRKGRPGVLGMPGLPGPLAHWLVKSDGTIEFIAPENQKALHLGQASKNLTNSNTIGVEASGLPAFADDRQTEAFVRLVANIADRWEIPTDQIFSHAEVAVPPGRKSDMAQQAPVIRQMVAAVRKRK